MGKPGPAAAISRLNLAVIRLRGLEGQDPAGLDKRRDTT